MRSLVPAETLVYLEANDLAAALQPIVDSKPFTEAAKRKPDFSALKGVQLVVAVTGFETSEEKLTDEHSVGRVQPHFVAVADTHAWNYQAIAFAEKKLGSFVTEIYDSEPTLEKTDKNGGKYFTWKAKDGRKAYALVIDSIIYFGNDETAIEKCLAVKRGEADSIAKAGKVQPAAPGTLASGYVGPDGIAQIANIIGLKFASEAADETEVQSAIAGILPQLIRNSVTEISWTSTKIERGIYDKYLISMPAELMGALSVTLAPSGSPNGSLSLNVPSNFRAITRYNLRDPRIAWGSVLLATQKQAPLYAGVVPEFSSALFEPYGIRDAEMFLGAVDPQFITVSMPNDDAGPVVIGGVKDYDRFVKSLSKDLKLPSEMSSVSKNMVMKSIDGELGIVFTDYYFILGDPAVVDACLQSDLSKSELGMKSIYGNFNEGNPSTAVTAGHDSESGTLLAQMLSEPSESVSSKARYITETSFTKSGMVRGTVSDFGLIGSIIAQLAGD